MTKIFKHHGAHSLLVFNPFHDSEYPSLSHEIEVSFMLDDSRQYMRHWLSKEQVLELRNSLIESYPVEANHGKTKKPNQAQSH